MRGIGKLSQNGNKRVIIAGDGGEVFYPYVKDTANVSLAAEKNRFQNAASVALAAGEALSRGEYVTAEELLPVYLRLPQAERELKKKKEGNL